MRFTRLFLIVAALAAPVMPAGAANLPTTATLALVPDTVLPGLPAAFVVTIYNPDDAVHRIGNRATVHVTSQNATFDAVGLDNRTSIVLPSAQLDQCGAVACLDIPAHGQRQLYLDFGPALGSNDAFADRRLSTPGDYTIQLELMDASAGRAVVAVQTNPTRLTVRQPTGVDSEVWQRLQEISGGGWGARDWILSGDAVAREIRNKYPASGYAPWVAAIGDTTTAEGTLSRLDTALLANPAASLRDNLLLVKGAFAAQASGNALEVDRNIDRCLAFADVARSAYKALNDAALSDRLRAQAVEALTHVYTRRTAEDTLRQLLASDPPAPLKVTPQVECVTPGTGQVFTARFGYTNANPVIKVLPLSDLNEITPAPRDQGQPRVFKPGTHLNVFVASSPGGELKWHLDGNTVTATPATPRCSQ